MSWRQLTARTLTFPLALVAAIICGMGYGLCVLFAGVLADGVRSAQMQ